MAERLLRTLRVRNEHRPGVLGRLAGAIGSAGANIGDIRTLWVGPDHIERDLDILIEDKAELEGVIAAIAATPGVDLIDVIDDVHELHIDGKLEIRATHPVQSIHDLRRVYTPGVAEVVNSIVADPDESYTFTTRS
jgi:malate dehydrogenase (oxaloacetate-decarboxylating)